MVSSSTHSCLFTAKDFFCLWLQPWGEKWRPSGSARASRFQQDTSPLNAILRLQVRAQRSAISIQGEIQYADGPVKSVWVCVCACVSLNLNDVSACLCVSAYDFEWSNLADERVAIVRGIIWLLLLR